MYGLPLNLFQHRAEQRISTPLGSPLTCVSPGVANFQCNNIFNHNLTLLILVLKAIYVKDCRSAVSFIPHSSELAPGLVLAAEITKVNVRPLRRVTYAEAREDR